MKKYLLYLPALMLIFTSCDNSTQVTYPIQDRDNSLEVTDVTGNEGHKEIPGRFIVTLEPKSNPANVAGEFDISPDYVYRTVLNGFAGEISDAARNGLMRDNRVVRIEKDGVATTSAIQNNATWGLDRVDQRQLPLDASYTYNSNGTEVESYIIDTGIRFSHVDFQGRVPTNYYFDAFNDGQNGNDCNGHGTHVAGTVGGAEYGVAKNTTLVAVRVLDCSGSGTFSGVIAGMDWVAQNATGPSVANMSLGGGSSQSVDDAVQRMYDAGIPVIVAAGNGDWLGRELNACGSSPAGAPGAYTIGATSDNDSKTSWSNYGDCVNMFAPGAGITSAWYTNDTSNNTISGTSMASPHVAGIAALFLQNNPTATAQQVYDAITESSTKNIVKNSRTSNNHMVYSLLSGTDGGTPNASPTASFTADCTDLNCNFDGSGSFDSDGSISTYNWDFGDGSSASGSLVNHSYATDGSYTVTLTVTDGEGAVGSSSQNVTVSESTGGDAGNNPPVIDSLNISTRASGPWFRTTVNWSVSDIDSDLATVTVELLSGTSTVDSINTIVSGGSAAGETEVRTRGNADSVKVTVTDVNGNSVSETRNI